MINWFNITDIDTLDTPALVVYPDRVKQNIALFVNSIDSVDRLRPHVKTHKNKEATLLCLAAGIKKYKCATIAEAEMLAQCNVPDVLLAYQPVSPKALRFIQLIEQFQGTQFSCLVDNADAANYLNQLAISEQLKVNIYIDLNVGMNRSGIAPQAAYNLYQQCSALPSLKVIGLHAYDGHIHDAVLAIRQQKCEAAFKPVEDLIEQLRAAGFSPVVVAGGSPTFPIHAARGGVECSPGTFIYWDGGYGAAFTEQPFLPAALVVARVISLPDETKICIDLGHKSVAAENTLNKRVTFFNAPNLKPISQSEEHLVLDAGANHHYNIGDVLYGLPHHICPTVALYERATTIIENKTNGEWLNIARDRKISI